MPSLPQSLLLLLLLVQQLLLQLTLVSSFTFSSIVEQYSSSSSSSSSPWASPWAVSSTLPPQSSSSLLRSSLSPSHSPTPSIHHSSQHNNNQKVIIVKTNEDILSLADLRYNEWILLQSDDDDNGNNCSSDDDHSHSHSHHHRTPPPSRSSFRLATSDIYHERTAEGSTVFLAMMMEEEDVDSNNDGDDNISQRVVAVGAAELSPIELKGVFNEKDHAAIVDIIKPMYITDVVTSSSYRHRGIGSNLMHFIENYAWMEKGTRIVYLHVAMENVGARTFYERLGYRDVVVVDRRADDDECAEESNNSQVGREGGIGSSSLVEVDGVEYAFSRIEDGLIAIDYDRLAENAGTVGQILMMKRLSGPTVDERHHVTTTSAATFQSLPGKSTISGGGRGGFGRPKSERRRKR